MLLVPYLYLLGSHHFHTHLPSSQLQALCLNAFSGHWYAFCPCSTWARGLENYLCPQQILGGASWMHNPAPLPYKSGAGKNILHCSQSSPQNWAPAANHDNCLITHLHWLPSFSPFPHFPTNVSWDHFPINYLHTNPPFRVDFWEITN